MRLTPLIVAPLALGFTAGALAQECGQVLINEIRIDEPGTDVNEYFELIGPEGVSLDNLWYVVLGDSPTGFSGVVEEAIDLTGMVIPSSGLMMVCEPTFIIDDPDITMNLNFENNDNVTHMIVNGFTGAIGDDLDTDDDGVLDVMPFISIQCAVALIENPDPNGITEEHYYGFIEVGPDGPFVPGHVYRCLSPLDQFFIGQFDPIGGDDTPCAPNPCLNGDTTGDGLVNVDDLLAVLSAWGPCVDCPEDVDGDFQVGVNDLLIVLGQWF